ncbi:MAG: M23 family metallopeptidase [Clostridiales bacterium]|nr:M23 family metallopeptidase [Clostridiales bacterium]
MATGVALYDSVTEKSQNYSEETVNNSKDKSYKEEAAEITTAAKTAEAPTETATAKTAETATAETVEPETKKTTGKTTKTENSSETQTGKTVSADNLFSFDENSQTMLMPVEGQIVMDYSPEIAVFDATLEQYRTNDTICIAAETGTSVAAAADGVIAETGFDEINGNSVVIPRKRLDVYIQPTGRKYPGSCRGHCKRR